MRVGSVLIDYIVFLLLPLGSLLIEVTVGGSGLGIMTDRTVWFIACIIGFANCVVVPMIGGQTLGKIATGSRIVASDLGDVGRLRLFLRQTVGYVLTLATLGVGFLVAAILPSGKTLHDAVFGTLVVRARKSIIRI